MALPSIAGTPRSSPPTDPGHFTKSVSKRSGFGFPTTIRFKTERQLPVKWRVPVKKPSGLFDTSSTRLPVGIATDQIAGFGLDEDPALHSASIDATLPVGRHVILAYARPHAFSAELLDPPARSGRASASPLPILVRARRLSAVVGPQAMAIVQRRSQSRRTRFKRGDPRIACSASAVLPGFKERRHIGAVDPAILVDIRGGIAGLPIGEER